MDKHTYKLDTKMVIHTCDYKDVIACDKSAYDTSKVIKDLFLEHLRGLAREHRQKVMGVRIDNVALELVNNEGDDGH